MSCSALQPFKTFASEGASVGRLVAGYSKLEIGLMNCVHVALGDFNRVFKAMFKERGETKRIDQAENLGREVYEALGLHVDFLTAIKAMRHCLTIRSQYAHWIWWDDKSGQLAFANAEDIAKVKEAIDNLGQLTASRHLRALGRARGMVRLRR